MCVCHTKDYFLAYLRHIYLVYYVTKVFFSTRKPAFSILLICTKKIDTELAQPLLTKSYGEAIEFKQKLTNNKQFHRIKSKLSSNRIVFFSAESPSTTAKLSSTHTGKMLCMQVSVVVKFSQTHRSPLIHILIAIFVHFQQPFERFIITILEHLEPVFRSY